MFMKILFFWIFATVKGYQYLNDTVPNQLPLYKEINKVPIGVLTTSSGAEIEYLEATESINHELLTNEAFLDTITHLSRIRIPDRLVHPRAAGAFGYFTVTHDVTDICSADMFNEVGKNTSVFVRFSPVFTERGGADTGNRDTRGMAMKFYTSEGNFDLLALTIPAFFIKDPIMFPNFVNAFSRNPKTNIFDFTAQFDFATLRPESLHALLRVMGDIGIPDGYRYLPAYAIHTFQLENSEGEPTFVRIHILPDAGVRTLKSADAMRIAGEDPDYAIRDLYDAIGTGNYPTWTMYFQVMSKCEAESAKLDVFDVTRVWPRDDYPLRPVGQLVLNENPSNNFADVEQSAFCVGNVVPGIVGAPDTLFAGRRLSYRDAQNYRLGVNFKKITVNYPKNTKVLNYLRDGSSPVRGNMKDVPNYYPNSFNGPEPVNKSKTWLVKVYTDPRPMNFGDAYDYYTYEISENERDRLVDNLATALGRASKDIQEKAVKLFAMISRELAERLSRTMWNVTIVVEKLLPDDMEQYDYFYGSESVTKIIRDENGNNNQPPTSATTSQLSHLSIQFSP